MRSLALLGLLCLSSTLGCDGPTANPSEALAPGVVLFSLPTVDGDALDITTVDGGRTVLAFWATWCRPCETELARLDSLYADLRPLGLEVYAINVDDATTVADVSAWVVNEGYRFPVALDTDHAILTRYQPAKQIPFYVVLDGEGRVVEAHEGYDPGDMDALRGRLEQALTH